MQQGGYLWNKTAITAESVPDDETLGEFGAVRNVNRRERKLEESFQEGLEGTTIVAPRLHYVYSESNLGEKTFLASLYYGKCQICGKQIFRSNGKPYFEACNILPTNAIPDRYKHSIIAFQKVGIFFVYVRTMLLNLSTERRICLSLFR